MKLSIDPNQIATEDIANIANDELVQNVCDILNLKKQPKDFPRAQETLTKAYDEFLTGHYEVEQSAPEHIENNALKNIHDSAKSLLNNLNELLDTGNADQRLKESLERFSKSQYQTKNNQEIWPLLIKDPYNPHKNLRDLIADIMVNADDARDLPTKITAPKTSEDEIIIQIFESTYNSKENEQKIKIRKPAVKHQKI